MLTKEQRSYFDGMEPEKARRPVVIRPYDPKAGYVAEREMEAIRGILPSVEIRFLGASALFIAGRNDVDIYVCSSESHSRLELMAALGNIYGPYATNDKWKFSRNDIEVAVKVINPNDKKRKEQLKIHEMFLADSDLLRKYELMKMALDGRPYREYSVAKLDFLMRMVTVDEAENKAHIDFLVRIGAMTVNDHVITPDGNHAKMSFTKYKLFPHVQETIEVANTIAGRFRSDNIGAVVGLSSGGDILSLLVASEIEKKRTEPVLSFCAEKGTDGRFILKDRHNRALVKDRRVLVVDDTINSGDTSRKLISFLDSLEAKVVGMGVICCRNCITADELGLPKFYCYAYSDDVLYSYPSNVCPMCKSGVAISQEFGIGSL